MLEVLIALRGLGLRPDRGFFIKNFARGLFFFSALVLAEEGTAQQKTAEKVQEKIIDIQFVGNSVTEPRILLQEMIVHVGDPVDPARIETSRQAIMSLGLFQEVRAELLPADGGKILQIAVKEKHYVLPVPRANRNADGDISYGFQLRLDNVAGLNQQIRLTYENQQSADTNASAVKDLSFSYVYQRVMGTPYNIDFSGHNARNDINVMTDGVQTAEYSHSGSSVGVHLSRFIAQTGPSRGWRVGNGLIWSQERYQYVSGTPDLYANSKTVSWVGLVDFTDIRDYLYSRAGESYGYNIERATPALGSDYEYVKHNFYYRSYNLITEKPHVSLDWQLQLGFSDSFPGDAFALGSSDTLRGYERNSITGRSFILANVEYLTPLFEQKEVRGVVFMDIGNAYPDNHIDLFDVKTSVGVGLRVNLRSFVKIQLRLDLAYALKGGGKKTYGGTRDIF